MQSALFTPMDLRGVRLANRIVVSPMCQYSAENGCAGDWHLMHLGQFSISGAGLLMVEMTNVEARGRISPHCLGLYDDDTEQALARVVAFCRRYGNVPMGVQLAHAGRKASTLPPWQGRKALSPQEGGWQTVSASAVAAGDDSPEPLALSGEEIAGLVDAFAAATRRARRIGFDAIELHAAHGYLLHQFLSPIANRRDDAYGGSLDNRMRFPLEVYDAVRAEWPQDRPLGVRISAVDYLEGGWRIEDSVVLGERLAERGCDWIDVSSGGIAAGETIAAGPGYQVPFAERVRRETGLTTMAVGLITEPRQAEAIVASGQADMVALARGMLYDPRWAWHAAAQLGAEVAYPNQYARCRPRA
ncbi:MAG: oxidoreductase [Gammaproteobacteria bacterium]|nr:oxidoreductase [Gammaproteobacteria bacterium]NIM74592.1 oxidoreductase [Gammaproteobacteria bacterium]NIO26425.1 oxidoreductase [Gammaproteobacteria bacterium]NIO66977.1 oxidoreductase [Gammaproteobacteria bacterium]NIP46825.1 NADH:flavin oxidoreductase/NADH oxidase [Gammaproteobacteria bacterium]